MKSAEYSRRRRASTRRCLQDAKRERLSASALSASMADSTLEPFTGLVAPPVLDRYCREYGFTVKCVNNGNHAIQSEPARTPRTSMDDSRNGATVIGDAGATDLSAEISTIDVDHNRYRHCFKAAVSKHKNRPSAWVKGATSLYCDALHQRHYDDEVEYNDFIKDLDELSSGNRFKGIWMIQPVDISLHMIEHSVLFQIGGLAMKVDVQLVSLKYLLRQAFKRYGSRYAGAANMLVDIHNNVGIAQEVRDEVHEDLDQVLSVLRDEALKNDTIERPGYMDVTPAGDVTTNANHAEEYRNPQMAAVSWTNRYVCHA